jgi:hypothetical protein
MITTENTIEEKTEFKFDELSTTARQHAIEDFAAGGIDYDWWEGTYEDAAGVGLEITSFETQYRPSAEGKFNWSEQKSAHAIMAMHGEGCETYKAAVKFLAQSVLMSDEDKQDAEYPDDASESWTELCETFLKDVLDGYAKMLKSEIEYLESYDAAEETIAANDYDFDEAGDMV